MRLSTVNGTERTTAFVQSRLLEAAPDCLIPDLVCIVAAYLELVCTRVDPEDGEDEEEDDVGEGEEDD